MGKEVKEEKTKFKGWGKGLVAFAAENDAQTVADMLRADLHETIEDAIEIAEVEFEYDASACLKRAITIVDCAKFVKTGSNKLSPELNKKLRFTIKSKSEDYRKFFLGFCNRFGAEISSDAVKGVYVYAFSAEDIKHITDRADKLSDILIEKVN